MTHLLTCPVSDPADHWFTMSLKHFDHDGRTRFITLGTHRGLPVLNSSEVCSVVYEQIETLSRDERCIVLAWVIMPEHVHLVLLPPVEAKLGNIVADLKSRSARIVHGLLLKSDSPLLPQLRTIRNGCERFVLWRKRCFDRNCRSDEEVYLKIRYCHWNPVRRGLVEAPEDYLWSSARRELH